MIDTTDFDQSASQTRPIDQDGQMSLFVILDGFEGPIDLL